MQTDGNGTICLVYSIILSRGIENIRDEMDLRENALLSDHGYASQELINIMLVGRACSNGFNGENDLGDGFILKGVHKQAEIGFLTLFEAYGYFEVGSYLKNPVLPIWIVCSESHFSVLFSTDLSLARQTPQAFDMIYYDELAK